MEQEFYKGLAHRVRDLAEKADPFTRRRLLPSSIFSGPGEV
jgi:hypothetical protein